MRAALVQLTSADGPEGSLARLAPLLARAEADLVCTPEMTNMVAPRDLLLARALSEEEDPVLAFLREEAARRGLWIAVGSLALRDAGALVNRSLLLDPQGAIAARYDKLHMFDVDLGGPESYRESATFRSGTKAVVAPTPMAALGLTICYDLRFPTSTAPWPERAPRSSSPPLPSPCLRAKPTGRSFCAPAPSKPAASSSPPPRPAPTRTPAAPGATPSPSRPGAPSSPTRVPTRA
jgi:predicted amidohydrolase